MLFFVPVSAKSYCGRSYAVECSAPCSSAMNRRWTSFPTPDESGNYNRLAIKKFVGNNDRCSLLECVSPMWYGTV